MIDYWERIHSGLPNSAIIALWEAQFHGIRCMMPIPRLFHYCYLMFDLVCKKHG